VIGVENEVDGTAARSEHPVIAKTKTKKETENEIRTSVIIRGEFTSSNIPAQLFPFLFMLFSLAKKLVIREGEIFLIAFLF
jgi:hypothetical protein